MSSTSDASYDAWEEAAHAGLAAQLFPKKSKSEAKREKRLQDFRGAFSFIKDNSERFWCHDGAVITLKRETDFSARMTVSRSQKHFKLYCITRDEEQEVPHIGGWVLAYGAEYKLMHKDDIVLLTGPQKQHYVKEGPYTLALVLKPQSA